jgi:hypothetical protein
MDPRIESNGHASRAIEEAWFEPLADEGLEQVRGGDDSEVPEASDDDGPLDPQARARERNPTGDQTGEQWDAPSHYVADTRPAVSIHFTPEELHAVPEPPKPEWVPQEVWDRVNEIAHQRVEDVIYKIDPEEVGADGTINNPLVRGAVVCKDDVPTAIFPPASEMPVSIVALHEAVHVKDELEHFGPEVCKGQADFSHPFIPSADPAMHPAYYPPNQLWTFATEARATAFTVSQVGEMLDSHYPGWSSIGRGDVRDPEQGSLMDFRDGQLQRLHSTMQQLEALPLFPRQ